MAGRPRVLVFEEDQSVASVVREVLDGAGFDTMTARHGVPTPDLRGPRPTLLLLDLLPAAGCGHEILSAIRRAGLANIPVVLLSGLPQVEAHMRELGAVAFVRKPFDIDDLVSTCRSAAL